MSINLGTKVMIKLVYTCPVCLNVYEVHVHSPVYEYKKLSCSRCKVVMQDKIEEIPDADNETT